MTIVINKHFRVSAVLSTNGQICVCADLLSFYEVCARPLHSLDEMRAFCKHSDAVAFFHAFEKLLFPTSGYCCRRVKESFMARRIEMFHNQTKKSRPNCSSTVAPLRPHRVVYFEQLDIG